MKFHYKKFELPPGERREFLLKPIIPIFLFHKKNFVRVEALIDSGADFCVFHSEIAEILRIPWKKGDAHKFIGVTGENGYVYFHSLKLKIGKWIKTIQAGFTDDLSEQSYGILGQEDFFEFFNVIFALQKGFIDIVPFRR